MNEATPGISLAPVTERDFAELRDLAQAIWRQHYVGIVSAAQVDYMLAGRMNDDALRRQIRSADRWLDVLRVSGSPVGYCSAELGEHQGADGRARSMKLGQLYVLESCRGQGFGRHMLHHVEHRGRGLGCEILWLQVNKRNASAIAFYEGSGFGVAREAVFDIGSGFVMDDYVMEKRL